MKFLNLTKTTKQVQVSSLNSKEENSKAIVINRSMDHSSEAI